MRDAQVLDAEALGVGLELGLEAAVSVDDPVGETIGAAGHRQVREARAVLEPEEQQRLAIELRRGRIEVRVHRLRQIACGQDRVSFVAGEQLSAWLTGPGPTQGSCTL